MESVDSSSILPTQINGLTKNRLQELSKDIIIRINRYDCLIQRQLEQSDKNYKIIIELCEEKLDLLSTYKDYRTVLATLSA